MGIEKARDGPDVFPIIIERMGVDLPFPDGQGDDLPSEVEQIDAHGRQVGPSRGPGNETLKDILGDFQPLDIRDLLRFLMKIDDTPKSIHFHDPVFRRPSGGDGIVFDHQIV